MDYEHQFSDDLIQRAIAYYAAHGEIVNVETANEYLHALSELYESFMEFAAYEP